MRPHHFSPPAPRAGATLRTLALLLAAGLLGCAEPPEDSLARIQAQGELRVITRNGPTTYFLLHEREDGFEFELARRFARHLGVELRIDTDHSLEDILARLERGGADVAAAGLTATPERQRRLTFGPGYMEVHPYLLYRTGQPRPRRIQDVIEEGGQLHVLAGSSHAEYLRSLRDEFPALDWHESLDLETIDLLEMLTDGTIDYTIINSNAYIAKRGFYPYLQVAFRVGPTGKLAWAMDAEGDHGRLLQRMEAFFKELEDSGELYRLIERYYSHNEDNRPIDSRTFNFNVQQRLPAYRELIETVAREHDMDWRLLAAIAYQESHWNPRARSPTGVRGIMMLTLPTARDLGVSNRLDAEQSLRGGARYFRQIHQRIPAGITEPDRTWFALAAYNVGLGHLEDARVITQRKGGDPNSWADVKEYLPLLAHPDYYRHTRFGYARGSEPVGYVQNIRHYYELLTWEDLSRERTPPPKRMDQYLPEPVRTALEAL